MFGSELVEPNEQALESELAQLLPLVFGPRLPLRPLGLTTYP